MNGNLNPRISGSAAGMLTHITRTFFIFTLAVPLLIMGVTPGEFSPSYMIGHGSTTFP